MEIYNAEKKKITVKIIMQINIFVLIHSLQQQKLPVQTIFRVIPRLISQNFQDFFSSL